MKKILLITIGLSVCVFADFSKSGDIVTDNVTKLQWQDNAQAKTTRTPWSLAIRHCEALSLGGFSDWRLPNVNELASLADDAKTSRPVIDTAFDNAAIASYWSSTTKGFNNSYYVWSISFNDGIQETRILHDGFEHTKLWVRCVRAGQ